MNKHQNLNSIELQNAAEMLATKVKGKKIILKTFGVGKIEPNTALYFMIIVFLFFGGRVCYFNYKIYKETLFGNLYGSPFSIFQAYKNVGSLNGEK